MTLAHDPTTSPQSGDAPRRSRHLAWVVAAFLSVVAIVALVAVRPVGVPHEDRYARFARVTGQVRFTPANAAQFPQIVNALEAFRAEAITHELSLESVFPDRTPAAPDAARLRRYPSGTWPTVLGHVQPDARSYMVSDGAQTGAVGTFPYWMISTPLSSAASTAQYSTVLCLAGIDDSGSITANSYTSVYSKGDVAGSLTFHSYATLVVDGDYAGALTSTSYLAASVSGNFTGVLTLGNYATVHIGKDFDGSADLKQSTLVIAGRATRAQLEKITGRGRVFVVSSDLPAGEHDLGEVHVIVGPLPAPAQPADTSDPATESLPQPR